MLSAIIVIGFVLTVVTAVPVGMQLVKNHPHGLIILFFVEFWERFSFYGMRSLLIFYLTQHFLFADGFSAKVFGSFTTLAYLLPLLAGFVA
ncbi:MAG: MFS transporter, partial [Gammaproteobacteria bacterium]